MYAHLIVIYIIKLYFKKNVNESVVSKHAISLDDFNE